MTSTLPSPLFCPAPCLPSRPRRNNLTSKTPRCAAHPPRRIASVAKDLQQALQTSLQARISRIDIQLPLGSKLGTERRPDEESSTMTRIAGDRELARIVSGMFERTGLNVQVVFSSERERAAAAKMWGPLAECECVAWERGAKRGATRGAVVQKKKKGSGKTASKATGFGKDAVEETVEPDVYILVGGDASFMNRVRGLSQSMGMDKLVIVANGNSGGEPVPVDLEKFFDEEFECVYHFTPNPHPKWKGGVLFRKYPDGKCFKSCVRFADYFQGVSFLLLSHF